MTMFGFLDSLEPITQAWVWAQKVRDLRSAMQAAEELGIDISHSKDNPKLKKEDKNYLF